MSPTVPPTQILFISRRSEQIIRDILELLSVEAHLDRGLLEDAAQFFLRDIFRIDRQQRGFVSVPKFAGYWAFWIRKLKPISNAQFSDAGDLPKIDLQNINELVAIQLGIEVLATCRKQPEFHDYIKTDCNKVQTGSCDGEQCFRRYAIRYLNYRNEFFHNYILYSMRNRTFGPHHFALFLEGLAFSACSGIDFSDLDQLGEY